MLHALKKIKADNLHSVTLFLDTFVKIIDYLPKSRMDNMDFQIGMNIKA